MNLFSPSEAAWLVRRIACAGQKLLLHMAYQNLERGRLHLVVRCDSQEKWGMNALWLYYYGVIE
ncbi:MAG: hypothetical protein DID91_2727702943 [Candidatus Nitrotoga sp. MKT]|nr:MAG: hypothetical protein DID91_2727702943 [Candidatus Nitrotoga sp. MKT]